MIFHRLRRFYALIFFLPISAFAQSSTSSSSWNAWIYQTPAGWQTQETPPALVLVPEGASSVNEMRLLAAEPTQESLSQWFDNAVRRQASTLSSFHLNAVQQGTTVHGKPKIYVTGQGVTPKGQKLVISYMGLLTKDGQGLLMETRFDPMSAFRYLGVYGQFVRSLEPGTAPKSSPERTAKRPIPRTESNPGDGNRRSRENDQPAKPNPPTAGPSDGDPPSASNTNGHGIYDWFGSFYNTILPGPNYTISTSMVWTFYRFFPNGYVYEGVPAGTDPATITCPGEVKTGEAKTGEVKGGQCKTYTIAGNTLTIAGEKPHEFAEEGAGIKIDGKVNNRVRRAGKPLNGRWETSSGGGILATVALSQHMLTLRPDGTFSIEGSTGVSTPNAASYSSSAYSGRYKAHDYTIEFDYASGRVVRQSFLLPYADDNVFLVGNAMYFVPTTKS